MEICRVCWSCSSICGCGDEAIYEEAEHCENCGTISPVDDLDRAGFCDEPECQEASEDYQDIIIPSILNLADKLLDD